MLKALRNDRYITENIETNSNVQTCRWAKPIFIIAKSS